MERFLIKISQYIKKNDILIVKEYYLCKLHNEVFEVDETRINTECFLPVWEGVSGYCLHNPQKCLFPPYMGGCIAAGTVLPLHFPVSSLYGRVYRR